MQFEISDEAAITLTGEFYEALSDGYPVDAALAEARRAIFEEENELEWATPVLYMRSPDGVIFDVREPVLGTAERERAEEEAEVAREARERRGAEETTARQPLAPPAQGGQTPDVEARFGVSEIVSVEYHGLSHIAFSPDGRLLAAAGAGKSAPVWALPSGQEVERVSFQTRSQMVGHEVVAFSPDARYLATVGKAARMWEIPRGLEALRVEDVTGLLTDWSLTFSPSGATS